MEDEATRTLELDTKTLFFSCKKRKLRPKYTGNIPRTLKRREKKEKKLTMRQTVHKLYNNWNRPESWIVNISHYMLLSFLKQFNLKSCLMTAKELQIWKFPDGNMVSKEYVKPNTSFSCNFSRPLTSYPKKRHSMRIPANLSQCLQKRRWGKRKEEGKKWNKLGWIDTQANHKHWLSKS